MRFNIYYSNSSKKFLKKADKTLVKRILEKRTKPLREIRAL
jgi:hypothetical protein